MKLFKYFPIGFFILLNNYIKVLYVFEERVITLFFYDCQNIRITQMK